MYNNTVNYNLCKGAPLEDWEVITWMDFWPYFFIWSPTPTLSNLYSYKYYRTDHLSFQSIVFENYIYRKNPNVFENKSTARI